MPSEDTHPEKVSPATDSASPDSPAQAAPKKKRAPAKKKTAAKKKPASGGKEAEVQTEIPFEEAGQKNQTPPAPKPALLFSSDTEEPALSSATRQEEPTQITTAPETPRDERAENTPSRRPQRDSGERRNRRDRDRRHPRSPQRHDESGPTPQSESPRNNESQHSRGEPGATSRSDNSGDAPAPNRFDSVSARPEFGGHARALQNTQSNSGGHMQQQGVRNRNDRPNRNDRFNKKKERKFGKKPRNRDSRQAEGDVELDLGNLLDDPAFETFEALSHIIKEAAYIADTHFDFDAIYTLPLNELRARAQQEAIHFDTAPNRMQIIQALINKASKERIAIHLTGVFDPLPDDDLDAGTLVYERDNYRVKGLSAFVPECLVRKYGILPGHILRAVVMAPREEESCPVVIKIESIMGKDTEMIQSITPFTELTPYYPTERILLETPKESGVEITWDDTSMRTVDIVSPIGFGQRGIIVAPPRTGKTMIMQSIAHAVQTNFPKAHLIILLVDERPEEVTDFRRRVDPSVEVIASTFDENAESHVHAAEVVIEKCRRMVEHGEHVVLLLDSITRLARAYNTTMPNSGKILSGGVEANALQKPKRFFGSARNIEGGGSLTILATALVDTGSKMDEVIFEEFKGTGNMELHLDRELVNKRIFPAISFDKSGTRKEELLYHPQELQKIYSLRRAMKGVPSTEAMEMLIQRIKKSKSNAEFLLTLNR